MDPCYDVSLTASEPILFSFNSLFCKFDFFQVTYSTPTMENTLTPTCTPTHTPTHTPTLENTPTTIAEENIKLHESIKYNQDIAIKAGIFVLGYSLGVYIARLYKDDD